jgi:hypothetical protein
MPEEDNTVTKFRAPWLIITGFGFDDYIYQHLLLHGLLIAIDCYNSQSIFRRTFLPWLSMSRPILVLVLRLTESESYVTTDGQSANLSENKAPIWGLRPDFYYRRTVAGLLMWGALSDERTGLSFTIAAGPSQRSYSRVRAPWDSRPYFVSDLRLPFSSPPTTRRVMVEVFDPASTRVPDLRLTTYIISRRTHRKHIRCPARDICEPYRKHLFLYCCIYSRLHSKWNYPIVACVFVVAGMCLPSRCPATGLHITISTMVNPNGTVCTNWPKLRVRN